MFSEKAELVGSGCYKSVNYRILESSDEQIKFVVLEIRTSTRKGIADNNISTQTTPYIRYKQHAAYTSYC